MELRHLRYFVAVAEELNFSRAAERLFMAQPPLSQQIRQLEAEIGTPLFVRTPRRVTLTAAGAAFLEDARAILARVATAADRAARIGRGDEGRLRVGFASSTAYELLPQVVRRFRERHPGVRLELSELLGHEQTQALREHRIDVGLAVLPTPEPGLAVETVSTLALVIALPADHPLAALDRVPVALLDEEPFVAFPRPQGSSFALFVQGLFEGAGVAPRLVQVTEELQTALGLVTAGLGFTLAPASVQNLHREGLVYRSIVPTPSIPLGIASRADDASPLVPRFLAVAREAAGGGAA